MKLKGNIMSLIYWIANLGYTFKFWGVGWGILNIILPFALIWDALKYLINLIHPGLK